MMSNYVKHYALPVLLALVIGVCIPLYAVYLAGSDVNLNAFSFIEVVLIVWWVGALFLVFMAVVLGALKLRWLSDLVMYYVLFWVIIAGFIFPLVERAGMVELDKLPTHTLNLVIVSLSALVMTVLTFTRLKSAVQLFAVVLTVGSVGAAMPTFYDMMTRPDADQSVERFLTLSNKSNVLVLSFDGLAGNVAARVLEADPELKKVFGDFVFFNNAVSTAPATVASLRSEVLGNIDFRALSENSKEVDKKLKDNVNSIQREINAQSDVMTYGVYGDFNPDVNARVAPGALAKRLQGQQLSNAFDIYTYAAARVGTGYLSGIVGDGVANLKKTLLGKYNLERMTEHKGASWDAEGTLQVDDLIELTHKLKTGESPRVVRYMHFLHTHFPVDFDETCQYRSDDAQWFAANQNLQGLLNETRCSLQQAAGVIEKLKALGVYDKTLLVLKSDHGAVAHYFEEAPDSYTINGHSLWGYNRYRPLLMVKAESVNKEGMSVNNDPVSLSDLAKTLCLKSQTPSAECDRYPGLDLLGDRDVKTDPYLYIDVVKDAKSSYTFDEQKTAKLLREADIVSAFKKSGEVVFGGPGALYEQRLDDLGQLNAALARYYEVNGAYPKSDQWDGIYSSWGRSAPDWIRGLAPTYIPKLIQDPTNTDSPTLQYLYSSNGVDYKLIAHGDIKSCQLAAASAPQRVDPARNCWAFGYWSAGAVNW